MKIPWRARTSLFARMSLIFGLLVTVPLATSGLILSLIGRHGVLTAGNNMAKVGADVVHTTTERLVQAVAGKVDQVTEEIAGRAQRSLQDASAQHVRASDAAIDQAAGQIITQGQIAFLEAGRDSAETGKKAVGDAADDLRKLHHESLNDLKTQFVNRTNAQLQEAAKRVTPGMVSAVSELAYSINEQKATALAAAAERGLSEVVNRLSITARHGYVQQLEADAEAALRVLTGYEPRSLTVVQAVLLTPGGEEIVRVPPRDLAQPPDWSAELRQVEAQLLTIQPLRAGPDGVPVLRLVQRVNPVDDYERPAALVADVRLSDVVQMAERQNVESAMLLLVTAEGRVLSSKNAKQVGQQLPALADHLRRLAPQQMDRRPALPRFRVQDAERRPYLAVAKPWAPASEAGAAAGTLYAVVAQPVSEAQQPVKKLEQGVTGAWKAALDTVGETSKRDIARRMREIRPRQLKIAQNAATRIDEEIRAAGNSVPGALRGARAQILSRSRAEILRQTQQATGKTREGIKAAREAVAISARGTLHWVAANEAWMGIQQMQSGARSEGNKSAGRMILNSGLLIFVFLALALLLATMTSRSIVSPINRLVHGTQALAGGDYSQRITVESEDELGRLARGFNEMAVAIELGQTELHHVNEGLVAQKQRIQTIVDSSPDGLVMFEPDGRIGLMNPAAREMLHLRREELASVPFPLEALPEQTAAWLRHCLDNVAVGGPAAEIELEGAQRRILQYRGVTIAGDDGRQGLLLHLHDITRERQIDEMKSDFISLVSHELRTPLTSILGFSSYLLTGKLGAVSEQQHRALDSVHRQAKRLSAIIADFLDVSRIESGRVDIRRDPVSVDSVARRVIADLQPQAAEKAIRVEAHVEPGEDSVIVAGDEARIAQVFTNLVGNALKFTDQEGRVDVLLSRRNGEVFCRVKDTGCGILPDELERVFDRFYQVEKVVTRKSGGTGLGLAIVKNIVEAHGGRIWIESAAGEGTEVSFTLPAVQ